MSDQSSASPTPRRRSAPGEPRRLGRVEQARVPPHNTSAEESLIGAMLVSADAIADVSDIVTGAAFYNRALGDVHDTIVSLTASGVAADAVTVSAKLSAETLEAVGGVAGLLDRVQGAPLTANASHYARLISEEYTLRRLIAAAGEISDLCYDRPEDAGEVADRAEQLVFAASARRGGSEATPVGDVIHHVTDVLDSPQPVTGLPTGFDSLDKLLGGLQPSYLYVIGGRPSMGKTALCVNMGQHVSITAGLPTLMFALESSITEITGRILSSEARVNLAAIRQRGRAGSQADWERITTAVDRITPAPLLIDDDPYLTIGALRGRARRVRSRMGGLGLIVVDYLQLMESAGGRRRDETRQTEVAEISRGLKLLARELECPIVALSQLSRNLEMRQDKRPMLADLRESGAIEQDADVVMFIYRDEVYHPDQDTSGRAELLVAKNRNGPTQTIELVFLGHYSTFAEPGAAAVPGGGLDGPPAEW